MYSLYEELWPQLAKVDPNQPIDKWPKIHVDGLTRHNPEFWSAYYEVVPGSGVLEIIYASMLQGSGEILRSQQVAIIGRHGTFTTKNTKEILGAIIRRDQRVINAGSAEVDMGIAAFDKGDYEAARELFRSALNKWPQFGLAYFELGLTQYFLDELAAGRTPPAIGTVKRQEAVGVPSKEVYVLYAKSLEYDPLIRNAYQGEGMSRKLAVVARGLLPAYRHLSDFNRKSYDDGAIDVLAMASQEIELHDIAILAKQVQVSRRNPPRFQPDDHPFIKTSINAIAPGRPTNAALQRLAGDKVKMFRFRDGELLVKDDD